MTETSDLYVQNENVKNDIFLYVMSLYALRVRSLK